MARSRSLLVAVTLVGLIVTGSCSRAETVPAPGSKGAPSAERPEAGRRAAPRGRVAGDYLAAMEAYYQVARDPDPDHHLIEATRDGPSRRQIVAQLEEFRASGTRVTYPDGLPTVEVLDVASDDDGTAVVTTCVVDRGVQVRDGVVVDDDVVSHHSTAVLHRRPDRWVVTDQTLVGSWNDGDGCRP